MSRVRGRKKRPSLPPITPSVSPDDEFLGFEEPGAGPAEMTREAIDTTTSGDSTALRVFCVEAKAVAGLDLTDCMACHLVLSRCARSLLIAWHCVRCLVLHIGIIV